MACRGGRPDLAENALKSVTAPTLFIVGSRDPEVLRLNEEALEKLTGIKSIKVIKGATHLFEEAGALEQVAVLTGSWFLKYLAGKEEVAGQESTDSSFRLSI